jgi:Rrf2 family protein
MLSQTADYALRAVLYIAERGDDGPVRVGDMAHALHIPQNYLSKILHRLVRSGVLRSTRGKAGGFQLGVPADKLHLHAVVSRFDRIEQRRRCLLGRSQCSDHAACAAHARWREVADTVAAFFRETTVADLTRGAAIPVS